MPPVKFFESLDLDPFGLFLDGHELNSRNHPSYLLLLIATFLETETMERKTHLMAIILRSLKRALNRVRVDFPSGGTGFPEKQIS
jgi:hypothetical protein